MGLARLADDQLLLLAVEGGGVASGGESGEADAGGAVDGVLEHLLTLHVVDGQCGVGGVGPDGELVLRGVGVEAEDGRIGGVQIHGNLGGSLTEVELVLTGGDTIFGGDIDKRQQGAVVEGLQADGDGGVVGLGRCGDIVGADGGEVVDMERVVHFGALEAVDGIASQLDAVEPGAVDELDIVHGDGIVGFAFAGLVVGGDVDQDAIIYHILIYCHLIRGK